MLIKSFIHPTNSGKFKNCSSGATAIVKNSDKEKYVYSGYEITFDNAGSRSFDNGFARTVMIFGIDTSSSSHSENRKINFLVQGEGPTYSINRSFGSTEKKLNINFNKSSTSICLSLHNNADSNYFFVNRKSL